MIQGMDVENACGQKCNNMFAWKWGNVSNLAKHLLTKHNINLKKCTA